MLSVAWLGFAERVSGPSSSFGLKSDSGPNFIVHLVLTNGPVSQRRLLHGTGHGGLIRTEGQVDAADAGLQLGEHSTQKAVSSQ